MHGQNHIKAVLDCKIIYVLLIIENTVGVSHLKICTMYLPFTAMKNVIVGFGAKTHCKHVGE